MARSARIALPEDDYLILIGQVAYMVSSLEWTILGDLPGLAQYLPADLNTPVLAGKSTGQIGGALGKAVDKIGDDDVLVLSFVYAAYIDMGLWVHRRDVTCNYL